MVHVLSILLAVASLVPLSARAQSGPPLPPVVARVNGVEISAGELSAEVRRLLPVSVFHTRVTPEKLDELRHQALDRLIEKALKVQEAERLGIRAPKKEVKAKLKAVIASYPSRKAFEARLKAGGVSESDLVQEIRRRILAEKVYQTAVVETIKVTGEDAKVYYDTHPEKFVEPRQAHVREILLKVPPLASADDEKGIKAKAEKIIAEVAGGLAFADAAKKYSEDETRERGGDLGWLHEGQLDTTSNKAVFGAKPGDVVGPFRQFKGYYVLKVEGLRDARTVPFKEIRDKLIPELHEKALRERSSAWMAGLKQKSRIERFLPVVKKEAAVSEGTGSPAPAKASAK